MGIKYKDPTTGQFKEISVKVADSLPIGTEVDYDGETVPTGWEEVDGLLTRKTYTTTLEDNANVSPYGSYGSINITAEEVSQYGEIVSVYSLNNAGAPMPCGYTKQASGNYSIRLVSNTTHKNMTVRVVFSKEKMNIIT